MTNKKAQKLTDKIIDDLKRNGIISNTLIEDLKTLRPYVVEENKPVVAKAIRQIFQHVEMFDTFAVQIPNDEEITDEATGEIILAPKAAKSTPTESLIYLMSLIRHEENKRNKAEIRTFNEELKEYMEDFGE